MEGLYQFHVTIPRQLEEKPENTSNHKKPGKQDKATSSLFPIQMIAKLERTQSNAQQNMKQTQA